MPVSPGANLLRLRYRGMLFSARRWSPRMRSAPALRLGAVHEPRLAPTRAQARRRAPPRLPLLTIAVEPEAPLSTKPLTCVAETRACPSCCSPHGARPAPCASVTHHSTAARCTAATLATGCSYTDAIEHATPGVLANCTGHVVPGARPCALGTFSYLVTSTSYFCLSYPNRLL